MDHTINIKYMHCEPHCSIMEALSFLFYVSRVVGSGWATTPKSLPTGVGFGLEANLTLFAAAFSQTQLSSILFCLFRFFFFLHHKEIINWWNFFILYKIWVMIIFSHMRLGWLQSQTQIASNRFWVRLAAKPKAIGFGF